MTNRERFIKTLKCEKIGGRVPHFELVFFLTMEVLGKIHPEHRRYDQWDQMNYTEKKAHINDMADLFIDVAKKYDHSAIVIHNKRLPGIDNAQWLLETIREKTGDEYYLMMKGDPTWPIPTGDTMMDFAVQMVDEPEKLNEISERRVEQMAKFAEDLDKKGHLLDGFVMCSDYCFNANPFYSPDQFGEFVAPYLKKIIDAYRSMGYYSIKHTDGNIMPILDQLVECRPDAIHSIDPQGGVELLQVRKKTGSQIALVGNVNCGLLQTGTDEECEEDVKRSLREGMEAGAGYIFSTSNCIYTGMPLERYEKMVDIWRTHGVYEKDLVK